MRPQRGLEVVFVLAAVGLGVGALFHVFRLVAPVGGDGSPPWRHALFVGVDAALALGFALRPRWFPWLFGPIVVQQLVSHGSAAYRAFQAGAWDLASIVIVIALPALFVALIAEQRSRRHGMPSLRRRS